MCGIAIVVCGVRIELSTLSSLLYVTESSFERVNLLFQRHLLFRSLTVLVFEFIALV